MVRSRDIAFGSGQGVHALSIPHLRYLRHSSYAPAQEWNETIRYFHDWSNLFFGVFACHVL